MSWITPVFVVWVVYNAWRGYKRGLWLTLLSLAGLAAAYVACFMWAPAISNALSKQGWQPMLAYGVAFLGVYLTAYFLVAELPNLIFGRFLRARWVGLGAGLGVAVGVVSGLIFVWLMSLLQTALALNGSRVEATVSTRPSPMAVITDDKPADPVARAASEFVAQATQLGAQAAGADAVQANVLASFTRSPQRSFQSLQALGKSPALQHFVANGEVQRALNTGNLDALIEGAPFQQLIHQPEMAPFRELALTEVRKTVPDASIREADLYLASRLSQAWRRMKALRDQPDIRDIMGDEQVKALIEQRNIPALLMNPKVHVLLGKVLSNNVEGASSSLPQAVPKPVLDPQEVEVSAPLFKWRDSEGRVHYGDTPPEDVEAIRLQY